MRSLIHKLSTGGSKNNLVADLVAKGAVWYPTSSNAGLLKRSVNSQIVFTEEERSVSSGWQAAWRTKRWQAERLPYNNGLSFLPQGLPFLPQGLPFLPQGLPSGTTHEWSFGASASRVKTCVPLSVFASIIKNYISTDNSRKKKLFFWVGKDSFPTPFLLESIFGNSPTKLNQFIFIDPPTPELKFWAVDSILRSSGTATVVASFKNLTLQGTQRLALAARHGSSLGLFVRQKIDTSSAATTRWRIEPWPSPNNLPHWKIKLLKSKGTHPDVTEWIVEVGERLRVERDHPGRNCRHPSDASSSNSTTQTPQSCSFFLERDHPGRNCSERHLGFG